MYPIFLLTGMLVASPNFALGGSNMRVTRFGWGTPIKGAIESDELDYVTQHGCNRVVYVRTSVLYNLGYAVGQRKEMNKTRERSSINENTMEKTGKDH